MQLHRLRLPLPLRLKQLNAYLIEGPAGYALVDTGMAYEAGRQALLAALAAHGVEPSQLTELFITHLHGDHWGHAGWLQSHGVPVVMSRCDSELLQHWFADPSWDQGSVEEFRARGVPEKILRRGLRALRQMRELGPPFRCQRLVEDGQQISLAGVPFQVLITPGHSPGHACLWHAPSRSLLVGDHVLPHITPNISRDFASSADPLTDYRGSLRRVRELDLEVAWPAHGEPMTNLRQRVDQILAHHDQREAQLLAALGPGPGGLFELGGRLFELARLDPWETWMALGETMAHLAALQTSGHIVVESEAGIERYRLR